VKRKVWIIIQSRIGCGRPLASPNGKGRKGRHVHLPREYKRNVAWYLRWKAERGEIADEDAYFLRTARSPRYYPTGIYKRWKRHCPNHRLHDARHTNATLLYEATNSLWLVQKQLGHASIATTQVYADVSPEQSIAGANAMERLAASLRRNPRAMAASLPSAGDGGALA
jgi:integrase